LPDPTGAGAYPIVTYTWLLCHRRYADPKVAAALRSVISYCSTQGQTYSAELGYIPLPAEVIKAVAKPLQQISGRLLIKTDRPEAQRIRRAGDPMRRPPHSRGGIGGAIVKHYGSS